MKIQVIVDSRYGEESNWVSDLSDSELQELEDVLVEIKNRRGYFPTGDYYVYPDPKPEDLYSGFKGWRILNRILPTPTHGFGRIEEMHIFTEEKLSLYL